MQPLGRITSRTSTSNFDFVAEGDVKKWDYIMFNHAEVGPVLAQVRELNKHNAETLAHCDIIGYRTERGFLRRPRTPPEPKAEIASAHDDFLKSVLGLKPQGLYLGLLEGKDNLKSFIDPKKLITQHLAVLAKSGAGKCVHPSTRILTAQGDLVAARDLLNDFELVKSSEDEAVYKPTKKVFVKSLSTGLKQTQSELVLAYKKDCKKLLKIRTASGREMVVTKDHPILSITKSGSVNYKLSKNISNSDYVAALRYFDTEDSNQTIDLASDLAKISENNIRYRMSLIRLKHLIIAGETSPKLLSEATNLSRSTVENYVYDTQKLDNLREINSDCFLASKRGIPIKKPRCVNEQLAQFLAMVIAEGTNVNKRSNYYRLIFTNKDRNLVQQYFTVCSNLFSLIPRTNKLSYYLDSYSLKVFLESINYSTIAKSREKEIPSIILRAKHSVLSEFIKYFFECEGTFHRRDVQLSSASQTLINQLATCLLRFDIQPLIKTKFKRATNSKHKGDFYYELIISGQDNLKKFYEQIGFVSNRKNDLLRTYLAQNKTYNTNRDIVPNTSELVTQAFQEANVSRAEFGRRVGCWGDFIGQVITRKKNPSREFFKRFSKGIKSLCSDQICSQVSMLANSDIYWDRVVSVEEIENKEGYVIDFTVKQEHNFIVETGLVVHNSYAVGVLLEELAELKVPVVIIDPHGEYNTIKNANKHSDDEPYFAAYGVAAKAYRNQVREFAVNTSINMDAEQLRLPIPQTASTLIESIPFKITNTQKGLLYNAIDELRKKKPKFRFSDVVEELGFAESASKWNLITGLRNLANTRLFSFEPTAADAIVQQGQLTIINLRGAAPDMQQMVVQALTSILFEMRKSNQVPPFFMVFEEAHNFCPERGFGEALSSKIIRTVASEGRKFGLGIAVISQRSARVDKSVLSQTGSQIILQITNPNDLKAVSHSFEGVSSETEDEVKNLPIGKALVIGAADYPLFVDVRVRKSQHGGRAQTFDFANAPKQSGYVSSASSQAVKTTQNQGFCEHSYQNTGTTHLGSRSELRGSQTAGLGHSENGESGNSALAYGLAGERSEPQNTILAFAPRILPKDIVMMEDNVKNAKLVLRPCYSVQASGAHIVLDAVEPAVYSFTDKLARIKIPDFVGKLSPDQRRFVSAASGAGTIQEVYTKSGLSFSTLNSMVRVFSSKGMMKTDGKNIALHPDLKALGALASSRFAAKPEFLDLPGEKMASKVSERAVKELIKSIGVDAVSIQKCYIPFYQVELAKGKSKMVDAMGYSLEI